MTGSAALTDGFARQHSYLRMSLTDRCNLRCTYCMPEHGIAWTPTPHLMQTEEVIHLAQLFTSLGINKIRLTGGEPLLRKDILPIVAGISQLSGTEILAMTTNGIGLATHASALRHHGLTSLTISLDTLKRERFHAITKRDRLEEVLAGIEASLSAGFAPLKINIVVMRGVNDDEIIDFISWGRDRDVNLRFIEYMPFPDNQWSTGGLVPYAEIHRIISEVYELRPLVTPTSSVAKDFAVSGMKAIVSFVTSMTESFCGTCNRLRLTADGHIKSCLFHDDERSLLDVMRRGGSDADVTHIIEAAVLAKPAAHVPMDELHTKHNRSMIAIGG